VSTPLTCPFVYVPRWIAYVMYRRHMCIAAGDRLLIILMIVIIRGRPDVLEPSLRVSV
jgi:hypothetical protein